MARFLAGRRLRARLIEQRLLHATALWIVISLAVILAAWTTFRLLSHSGQGQPANQQVALTEAPQPSSLSAPRTAGVEAAPTVDVVVRATVLGVSASPVPPDLPPPDALADSVASNVSPQVLLDVPRNRQDRNLNCELRSATDLALFYGWDFTWEELFEAVGIDPAGDPNVGFVGRSMNDPVGGIYPAGYGVYAEAIARGLRRMGVPATAHLGRDREWLKAQLDAGRPVVVWVTYGMQPQPIVEWQTARGDTVQGVRYEHTFVVAGYDESGVWVNDPWDATQRHYPWSTFEASWALLGSMALTIDEQVQP